MPRRSLVIALIAAGALGAAPAPPAAASDATLKTEIKRNLKKIRPALTAFQNAVDPFKDAKTATQLRTARTRLEMATTSLRPQISRYKRGVSSNTTSSSNGSIARKTLLSGLREFDTGLREYKRAVDKVEGGASKASVLPSLRKADNRFLLAAKREESALARLGVERPD